MLKDTVTQLMDSAQPLTHRLLRSLSGLDKAGLETLGDALPQIAVDRRRQMTQALVEMAEDDAEMDFEDVFRLLLADEDAEVRATAISGLWESRDRRLVDRLVTMMQQDPSSRVRAAAADILGHFGMLLVKGKGQGPQARRLLDALLDTFYATDDILNTEEVRRNALESAVFFADTDRLADAIVHAYDSGNVTLRAGALAAMGLSFDDSWTDNVLRELHSPEPELRYEAAQAAGNLWLDDAVPALVDLTKDDDQEVRYMAVWALGEIGGLQAKAVLTQILESNDQGMREAAEEALEELRFGEDPLAFDDTFRFPPEDRTKGRKRSGGDR